MIADIHYDDLNGNNTMDTFEQRGILAFERYEVRIEESTNFETTGPLFDYRATLLDGTPTGDGRDDIRDSDGVVTLTSSNVSVLNTPTIVINTLNYGANNHTYDFGFYRYIEPIPPTQIVPTFIARFLPATGETPSWREPVNLSFTAIIITVVGFLMLIIFLRRKA